MSGPSSGHGRKEKRTLDLESGGGVLINPSSTFRACFLIYKVGAVLGSTRVGPAQGLPGFLRVALCPVSLFLFLGTERCQRFSVEATPSRLASCSWATCQPTWFQNLKKPLDHFPGEETKAQ